MRIDVEYFAQLRTRCGLQQEHYELPQGSDIDALIRAIKDRHQGPFAELLGGERPIPGWITVLRNERVVEGPTLLEANSTVRFLAPISGG